MTGLLVSVRDADEAMAALTGGAAVIDVKEPARGSLGAADPATWRAVLSLVDGRVPVTAALGELYGNEANDDSVPVLAAQTAGLQLAKIGLAGAACRVDWCLRWRDALQCLPAGVGAVAVAYADWQLAQAPRPGDVIEVGLALGCRVVLFDTFTKSQGGLLDFLPLDALERLTTAAVRQGMRVVLAGSLTSVHFSQVLSLAPALVAVRGAACRGQRTGRVDAALVAKLASAISLDISTIVHMSFCNARDA